MLARVVRENTEWQLQQQGFPWRRGGGDTARSALTLSAAAAAVFVVDGDRINGEIVAAFGPQIGNSTLGRDAAEWTTMERMLEVSGNLNKFTRQVHNEPDPIALNPGGTAGRASASAGGAKLSPPGTLRARN